MERIGIAASKIAKGNLVLYNLSVIIIAFSFSLFLFFIAGCPIVLALIIIGYVADGVLPMDLSEGWMDVIRICMAVLTVVVAIFNLFAILRNIKITKIKDRSK